MTFVQHLVELRDKLLHSVIAILLIFIGIFPFANEVYGFIAAPIINVLPADTNIIAIGVISPFLTPLKMALIFAVYLAMPYLLFQIWSFIAPALYKHEKQMIVPLIVSSTILFYAGILFSFYVVFPVIFGFLSSVGPSIVDFTPDIQYYLDFVLKVSFAFGVAFEVPIATILLIMFNITTIEKLKKNRAYVIIGAFVLGMLLTPPDIISQVLIAIVASSFIGRSRSMMSPLTVILSATLANPDEIDSATSSPVVPFLYSRSEPSGKVIVIFCSDIN